MRYFAAFDGGGTKTRCLIADEEGRVLGDSLAGPSNYKSAGEAMCRTSVEDAFVQSLRLANLNREEVTFAYLGLSGADRQEDFDRLDPMCADIFGAIPFKIRNDLWIALRSGIKQKWGAVSICGTGFNAGVRNREGVETALRAETFELGNYGGGDHITGIALHKAFRSDEGTGRRTLLESRLPEVLGVKDMEEVFTRMMHEDEVLAGKLTQIPRLVFELAEKGDRECQDILIDMGYTMGEVIGRVIVRAGMAGPDVPVVLAGSIYRDSYPLLKDALVVSLHRFAPGAVVCIPELPPVAGALLSAMDELEMEIHEEYYKRIKHYHCSGI